MDKKPENHQRIPVVAVMGHIDHGKSSLLDYIRKTNTTAKEAGGITQRMSAYKVEKTDSKGIKHSITFLDTPGHEAFSALRSRGARVADIAILVVASDEGVKPQTVEAIKSIKEAGIPFIVAMNKNDKPGANIERLKQSLAESEVFVEGYGGDIPAVSVSAITGDGIDELLDMILLVAEIADLKERRDIPAEGVVIGAENSKTKGIGATIIIKTGILKSGMLLVCGDTFAPTRMMTDWAGKNIREVVGGEPVVVTGFDKIPCTGEIVIAYNSKKEAEAAREENKKIIESTPNIVEIIPENPLFSIPIILKTSTTDVTEAIFHEIRKIKNDRVGLKIIGTGVGNILESDVKLAITKEGGIVFGFDTKIDPSAKNLAERSGVLIETFDIIYKLAEKLKEIMIDRTPKMKFEDMKGKAKILKLFSITKDKQVIGARVEEGVVAVGEDLKIIRRDIDIGRGKIKGIQQSKMEAKEVHQGLEFGALIESKMEIAPGDIIETFVVEER